MVLQKPIYKVSENCDLIYLLKNKESAQVELNKALVEIAKTHPSTNLALGVWSENKIGIKIGTDAEKEFNSELKKSTEQGFRIFKKSSQFAKVILEKYGDTFKKHSRCSSGFGFEISTFFGINNVKAYHRIDDDLYLNLKRGIEDHVEMLEEVDYVDYLELCAELEKSN